MRLVRLLSVVTMTAAMLALLGTTAQAEPLAKEACDALKAEQAQLTAAGAKESFDKGAAWAKANLSAAKLREIERFIGLEEQLGFRCGLAKARLTLPPSDEDVPADPNAAAAAPTPTVPAAPVKKAAPRPKPKPAETAAKPDVPVGETAPAATVPPKPKLKPKVEAVAPAGPVAAPGEPPPARPKPSPKPKSDDAYRPPPPAGNPFVPPAVPAKPGQ